MLRLHLLVAALVAGLGRPSDAQLFAPAASYGAGASPVALAAGDFDGDGDPDLAVGRIDANDLVSVLVNDGSGAFALAASYDTAPGPDPLVVCCKPLAVAAADVDEDGDIDVAVLMHDIGTVRLLTNDGSGSFALDPDDYVVNDPSPVHSEYVAAAHLDGDRAVDLVVASPSDGSGAIEGHMAVLLNRGGRSGEFDVAQLDPLAAHFPQSVAVADLDDDGDSDLAVPSAGSNDVTTFLNDGAGSFALSGTCEDLLDPGEQCFAVGAFPWSLAAADFDGDGDQDLVAGHISADVVTVRLNDGAGDYAAGTSYLNLPPKTVFGAPASVAVGDFDCDGAPDLAAANNAKSDVAVLINRNLGAGVVNLFEVDDSVAVGDDIGYDVGLQPWATTVADFDGNGAPDVAVAAAGDDAVAILLNVGCPARLAFACRAAKLAAAGKAGQSLLLCHARAARKGRTTDAACLAKARDKLLATFAGAEAKGGCLITGDASALRAEVDAVIADVADDLAAVGGGACAAAKLGSAARKAGGRLSCHAKAVKKTALVDAACLGKVQDKLAASFAKAESQGGCATNGDAPAVAAKLDALAVDVVDALRP